MMHAGSAYGKVILLGEHAVVYGQPALCGALPKGADVDASEGMGRLIIPAWNVCTAPLEQLFTYCPPKDKIAQAYVAIAQALLASGTKTPNTIRFDWTLSFHIPTAVGLGASAALSVSLAKAIDHALSLQQSPQQIAHAAAQAENIFHGNASGLDAYLAQHGGFGLFSKEQGFRPLSISPLSLCIAMTGHPKDTKARVAHIARLKEKQPLMVQTAMESIGHLVRKATHALLLGNLTEVGEAMNQNQNELRRLEVSSPEIETLCTLARTHGALGAKLTGGGGGGCVIALAPGDEKKILSVWQQAGFSSFLTSLASPSSCIEGSYESRSGSSQ